MRVTHMWIRHDPSMNESCHTYGWVMSHISMWAVCLESCLSIHHTYEWVMSLILAHIGMSHVSHSVTHMDEPCLTYTHSHTHTHTHKHTHKHTHTLTYTHTLSLSHTHTHIHTHTLTYTHTLSHTHTHSYKHTRVIRPRIEGPLFDTAKKIL